MQTIDLDRLFQRLLDYRDNIDQNTSHNTALENTASRQLLGLWLQGNLDTGAFPNMDHMPFEPANYTRTCIAKESLITEPSATLDYRDFEALVMRWDKQAKTSIHGHPDFSFYYVVSGVFEVETFGTTLTSGLYVKEVQRLQQAEATWSFGEAERYDNCIHRITCLEPGFTFHVYSDDAKKGVVFG